MRMMMQSHQMSSTVYQHFPFAIMVYIMNRAKRGERESMSIVFNSFTLLHWLRPEKMQAFSVLLSYFFLDIQNWIKDEDEEDECHIRPAVDGYALCALCTQRYVNWS